MKVDDNEKYSSFFKREKYSVMKKVALIIFILATYSLAQAQLVPQKREDMKGMEMKKKEIKQQLVTYTCPMHPEIHSLKPGNCPKCGMKLVKEKVKPISSAKEVMNMAMPKDTAKHQYNMQKMQMDTVPKQKATSVIYTCPMHPEIQSVLPGNCPKCGMKLVKQKAKAVPENKMEMNMPMPKDTTKKKDHMSDMKMDNMPKENDIGYKIIENNTPPRTVRYDLYITDTIVNFAGKSKHAIAVNGSIPMPTLTFTEGDTAEI